MPPYASVSGFLSVGQLKSATIKLMLVAFLSWWYGPGWKQSAGSLRPRLKNIADSFSVRQLSRTLFDPWRRIITYPGASLGERFRAWGDNIFSRSIGFVVRCLVLSGALITAVVVIIFSVIEIIVWPVLPLLAPICLFVGLL